MKDQYVGDISDFEKYAILRAFQAACPLVLVVAWMLTPPDATTEGGKTGYLQLRDRYRELDPHVFDRLDTIVRSGFRSVSAIEEAGVLENARFVNRPLEDHISSRSDLFGELFQVADRPAIVFFDPDIGIAGKSVRKGRSRSSMYVFPDELTNVFCQGHSLVIYQHFPYERRDVFLDRTLARLRESCGAVSAFALWSSRVAFLVVPQDAVAGALRDAGQELVSRWAPHLRFTAHEGPCAQSL